MFWIRHPKQVGSQKAVAMQVVQRKAAAPASTQLIIVENKPVPIPAPQAAEVAGVEATASEAAREDDGAPI